MLNAHVTSRSSRPGSGVVPERWIEIYGSDPMNFSTISKNIPLITSRREDIQARHLYDYLRKVHQCVAHLSFAGFKVDIPSGLVELDLDFSLSNSLKILCLFSVSNSNVYERHISVFPKSYTQAIGESVSMYIQHVSPSS